MTKLCFEFILFLLFVTSQSQLLLNGVPLEFQLAGPISYTPTSGGINIPGYILRLGYTRHQWVGVKFMTLTSNNNYDTLIFKRATTSNAGLYQCTVSDYYVASGRQQNLMPDTVNNMDKQVTTTSDSNHFHLELYRTRGNTNGQDWQGGDFVQICFFTSDVIFNKDTWTAQYQSCYGFAVSEYVSKWVGYQIISNAVFDGIKSKIYGGFSGPSLRLEMYIYRPNGNLTGNQVTIKIGGKVSNQVGYDFHKCLTNKGDYFGNSTDTLKTDLMYSGYNDAKCSVIKTSTYTLLYFSRLANTFDQFDNIIGRKTNLCFIVGSNENCYDIEGQSLFPQMNIQSAIKLSAQNLTFCFALLILILLSF